MRRVETEIGTGKCLSECVDLSNRRKNCPGTKGIHLDSMITTRESLGQINVDFYSFRETNILL